MRDDNPERRRRNCRLLEAVRHSLPPWSHVVVGRASSTLPLESTLQGSSSDPSEVVPHPSGVPPTMTSDGDQHMIRRAQRVPVLLSIDALYAVCARDAVGWVESMEPTRAASARPQVQILHFLYSSASSAEHSADGTWTRTRSFTNLNFAATTRPWVSPPP